MMPIDPISIAYGIVIGTVITAVIMLIMLYNEEVAKRKNDGNRQYLCLNCYEMSPPTETPLDYCPYCGESYWINEEDE